MASSGRKLLGAKAERHLAGESDSRTAQSEIAAYAIVVDAKDNSSAEFYEHFGFLELARDPRSLFLPLSKAIKKLGTK
ncbi:hypothetical protein [Adhaeretor mobilis]|uniref:Acetyltransferase n=1 Tax=Adhaeretor mobilis TaxID=1930276 RepID=A0A517MZR0_9BACT|nr:hypothetical protein [Adhaeretor mobilis]QDT00382.1 hypothetical protein HG15A2_37180 [Adhaeretor mobilis]